MKNETEDAVEYNTENQIIAEYREAENIDCITEEEMTDLFGTTFFYYNVYANVHYLGHYDLFMYISDYDQYLIDNGYDPFFAEFIDNLEESYVVPWIELYDSLTLEDNYPCVEIEVDYFTSGLIFALEKRLDQAKTWKPQSINPAIAQKYENWISILKYIDGFMTPQELDVLDKCISTYASVCGPYERRKEIGRNLCYQISCFDIDLMEFESKIYRVDVQILYELTEILLELEPLFFCTTNSDNSLYASTGKRDWPISTFYYCWEILAFDSIQWYEMQTEISWVANGLIQDIWEADHVVFIMDEHNVISTEYDYYINQFTDSDQQNDEEIELGDFECLSEGDMFTDIWLVAGKEYPNFIDYFWEAELLILRKTQSGGFFTDYRDGFYEHECNNYSKFLCYNGDSGFNYCNKENCDGCTNSCTEIKINQQYVLWEKYVQPIESDEYFGPRSY